MEYDPLSSLTHTNRVGPSWRSVAKPIIVCSTPSLQKYRSRTYIWSGNSEIMHRDTLSKGKMWLCSLHPPAEHNAKTCMWYHTATYTTHHYRMHLQNGWMKGHVTCLISHVDREAWGSMYIFLSVYSGNCRSPFTGAT